MPDITIANGSSINITSQPLTPALGHYLREGLVFALKSDSSVFKQAQDKGIGDIDAGSFPVSLSPQLPSRSFAVSTATITVQPSFEASVDVLTGDKASDFKESLGPNFPAIPALVSFGFSAELESGPSGTVGDFAFGLLSGQEIKISNTCPVQETDLLRDAVQKAMSGLTLPHDLDDLRALPERQICTLEGRASLKFTAAVSYSILNNTLATAPFEILSNALNLKATSGPKLQVAVTHSNTHQLTIASLGKGVVRLCVSLAAQADLQESFDFSIGISGNIGSTDALQFLVEQVSGVPDKDLAQIRNFLSGQEQSDLSSQIKSVIQNACQGGISASLHDALKQSQEEKSLFIYEVDLNALDGVSSDAVHSALRGDFTQMTALGSALAGIKEIKSVSTLTLTRSHTLTLHLLGILNFSNVSSFMKKAQVARVGDTNDVVLAATDIKIVQNTVSPDHLRKVLTKSALITIAADSSPKNPDFGFQMTFFMKKAGINSSDLRQIANSLAFVSSPDTPAANGLLSGTGSRPDVFVYLALKLDKHLSIAMFKKPDGSAFLGSDDFVKAGQKAMGAILADDPDSSDRMRLFSLDLASWKRLRDVGAGEKVQAMLVASGMTNPASWTDFASIDWWAQAMGKMALALQQGTSLIDAQKEVLKDSEAGFDVPWALLATSSLLKNSSALNGALPVITKFAVSGVQKAAAA